MKRTALSLRSFAHSAFVSFAAALAAATLSTSIAEGATVPPWLALRPGTYARVDIAPWQDSDEPEAALAASAASMRHDYTADAQRPPDVVYQKIGVRVRVLGVSADRAVVRVKGAGGWVAFTRVDRLIPEIPAGVRLVAAGGFEGFADFFPQLATPKRKADRLPTGSRLRALAMGAGPYDPDTSDLVRVRVTVIDGSLRGRTGWVAVVFTGLPAPAAATGGSVAEQTCRCRLVAFDD